MSLPVGDDTISIVVSLLALNFSRSFKRHGCLHDGRRCSAPRLANQRNDGSGSGALPLDRNSLAGKPFSINNRMGPLG